MAKKTETQRPVTAADVAKQAGVSQSTVSRVFSKDCKAKIRPESRQRVLEAAQRLGYVPNAMAQTMASGHSGIIGVVVSNYFNLFYYQTLQIITNILSESGLRTMVFTADPQQDVNGLLESLFQYQVDGVILTSSALSHQLTARWTQRGLPAVLLNGYLPDLEISVVQSDQFGSGRMMAAYLTEVGHTRFAYVNTEHSPHKNYAPRQEGFLEGLREKGIQDCQIIPSGYSYQSGLEAGRALLSGSHVPDAIFCSGDLNALGVIDAVREQGTLRLGRDISVTGYDAPLLAELHAYSLTALTQQVSRLCQDCADLLRLLIKQPQTPPQIITRPMLLKLRDSSRPFGFEKAAEKIEKSP